MPSLTARTSSGGCASKLSPTILHQVLGRIPRFSNENVLVGFDTSDDAGVYKLSPEMALVQTVDFFSPIVDDPYTFGAIAAANALSDVYAMGGKPISALSILAWPAKADLDELAEMLKGGAEKIQEADCALLGGHSVADNEVKFGYAVTGLIHPDAVNNERRRAPGRRVGFHQAHRDWRDLDGFEAGNRERVRCGGAIRSMLTLNRQACKAMLEFAVHGCTDVTGFGLMGHAREMALASKVTLEIESARVQFLPGAVEYARLGASRAASKTIASSRRLVSRERRSSKNCCTIRKPRAACSLRCRSAMRRYWKGKCPTLIASGR